MATIGTGNKGALLIVDAQVGVMKDGWDASHRLQQMARAVDRARLSGVPVIWVQHHNDELPTGSPQWQWAPELRPAPGEVQIHKEFNSAFEQTELAAQLAALGASHIALAGAQSNWCIRATAYAALERGYDLTLIHDAHTTSSMALDDGSTLEAAGVVRDLNIAMQWLSYPGRVNRTAGAEDLDFAALA